MRTLEDFKEDIFKISKELQDELDLVGERLATFILKVKEASTVEDLRNLVSSTDLDSDLKHISLD